MRAGRCSVVRRVSLCYIKKMRKVQDRKKIIHEISAAAELYKKNLVGRQFLYVFDGRFIEVMYKAENFLHLTGVGTGLSAKQFYKYAVNRILSTSQILFNAAHPYDLCVRKLQHLCDMAELAASECFMLEEIRTSTQLYKFGTTNLDFTLCFGLDSKREGSYIAQSLRDENCFAKSRDVYTVTHILSKQNDKKRYEKLLYMDKATSMAEIPVEVLQMMEPSLLEKK